MGSNSDALTKILPDIEKAASAIAFEWRDVIDRDDLLQDMSMRLIEADYAETLLHMRADQRYVTLRKIATQIASDERVEYDNFTGNFYYSTREVRGLLRRGVLSEPKYTTNTERMDVEEGIDYLITYNPAAAGVLFEAYRFDEYDDRTGAARKALTRAVDSLTDAMNRVHKMRHTQKNNRVEHEAYSDHTGGPGSRPVLSNAAAQATASFDYDGNDDWADEL